VWPDEARDFTPWLRANSSVLGELLGMDLELTAAEHPVGGFFLDLIGRDLATGETVIVENQLEASDHLHLGQLLTYAGGTDPVNVVWVTPLFRDAHRAALDWLNVRTDDRTRFFGVEVSLVCIADSPVAPLLRLVAAPNDWGKTARTAASASATATPRGQAYEQFWTELLAELHAREIGWTSSRKGLAQNWWPLPSGVSNVGYNCTFGTGELYTEIFFGRPDAQVNDRCFARVLSLRNELEGVFGGPLQFQPLPDRKGTRVAVYRPGSIEQRDAWPEYREWFIDTQARLRAAFDAIGGVRALVAIATQEAAAARPTGARSPAPTPHTEHGDEPGNSAVL